MSILEIFRKEKKPEGKTPVIPQEDQAQIPSHPETKEQSIRELLVLKKPLISEKARTLSGAESNQYVFVVDERATKPMVRIAVERRYKVHVEGVNMIHRSGKMKQVGGRSRGRQSDIKKAIVSLKKGEKIDLV